MIIKDATITSKNKVEVMKYLLAENGRHLENNGQLTYDALVRPDEVDQWIEVDGEIEIDSEI